jgi:hypothetical protein
MAFPTSPANNQTALVNGIVYQWNASLGVWKRNGSVNSITVGQAVLNSNTASTSNTTGSLIVAGGAGITGNLYTGAVYISSPNGITFPDGTVQTTAGVAVDSYARTTANAATSLAQAAFDSANVIVGVNTTQNTNISIIQGVDNTQNTQIAGLQGVDLAQNSSISIIQGVDLTQNNNITYVNQYAASAYAAGNTNATNITYVNQYAAAAYASANTNATNISIIQGVNTTQNTNITAADSKAQAAFDKANTAPKTTTSSTAPSSPTVGDMWYDSDNDVLLRYTYDGTSNNWIDITGPIFRSTYIRQTYLLSANVS